MTNKTMRQGCYAHANVRHTISALLCDNQYLTADIARGGGRSIFVVRGINLSPLLDNVGVFLCPEVTMKTFSFVEEPAAHFLTFCPEFAGSYHVLLQVDGVAGIMRRVTVVTAADEVVYLQHRRKVIIIAYSYSKLSLQRSRQ